MKSAADREALRVHRLAKAKEIETQIGPDSDPRRKTRLDFLVRAFVNYDGDMEALKADLEPGELERLVESDPWFGKAFDRPAQTILEEGILRNLVSMATGQSPQTIPVSKVILPALNKRRYNQGVQRQETANEGLADFIRATEKPMSREQVLMIIQTHDPKFMDLGKVPLKMLTLDEAVSDARGTGSYIENTRIQEDEDLAS